MERHIEENAMRATILVDNRKKDDLPGEWGLSIYIEADGHTILLDTGASELFCSNAKRLGRPIDKVEAAVLSHAHYDHANGMRAFFEANGTAPFYVRETTAENCYFKKWFLHKYIGIPKHILGEYRDRIIYAKGDTLLWDGIYLIPHKTPGLSENGKRERMYQKRKGRWYPDDFSHEQSLVVDTEKGLVIFNSCSHGGAANIINEVAQTFPDKKIYGLVGGFHLFNKTEEEIRALGMQIKQTDIPYVCTGHCTGGRAYAILKEELGARLHGMQVGFTIEV